MSLAYKLWKIGNILTKEDIEKSVRKESGFKEGIEPVYLNIDFAFENNIITRVSLNKNSISMDKLFFSPKNSSGKDIYYLYPNLILQKELPNMKIGQLKNTIRNSVLNYCQYKYKERVKSILNCFDDNSIKIVPVLEQISLLEKDNYLIWLSIDGETFYEKMPEVWDNYYDHPFVDAKTKKIFNGTKTGFDIFTNKETEIGYKTDFKVFSYDQYHDSLNFRLDDNFPLSKESARKIKYAWKYILDNLVFYYKGLEYVIIPNLLTDNDEILRTVLKRFVRARNALSNKKGVLDKLKKEENKLKKEIEKLHNKKNDATSSEVELKKIQDKVKMKDLGIIQEFDEQARTLDEYINMVTLDYLFVNVNRTNLSFEINGTIEDVIPSKMGKVVEKMRKYKIEDLVKLGAKDRDRTYLQDFFNRDELYFALNRSSAKNSNSINTERLFLAKLLLSDVKINHSDLLYRFEYHRNLGYDRKKRMTKDGFQEWIQFPSSFVAKEKILIQFLQSLNKIQED